MSYRYVFTYISMSVYLESLWEFFRGVSIDVYYSICSLTHYSFSLHTPTHISFTQTREAWTSRYRLHQLLPLHPSQVKETSLQAANRGHPLSVKHWHIYGHGRGNEEGENLCLALLVPLDACMMGFGWFLFCE